MSAANTAQKPCHMAPASRWTRNDEPASVPPSFASQPRTAPRSQRFTDQRPDSDGGQDGDQSGPQPDVNQLGAAAHPVEQQDGGRGRGDHEDKFSDSHPQRQAERQRHSRREQQRQLAREGDSHGHAKQHDRDDFRLPQITGTQAAHSHRRDHHRQQGHEPTKVRDDHRMMAQHVDAAEQEHRGVHAEAGRAVCQLVANRHGAPHCQMLAPQDLEFLRGNPSATLHQLVARSKLVLGRDLRQDVRVFALRRDRVERERRGPLAIGQPSVDRCRQRLDFTTGQLGLPELLREADLEVRCHFRDADLFDIDQLQEVRLSQRMDFDGNLAAVFQRMTESFQQARFLKLLERTLHGPRKQGQVGILFERCVDCRERRFGTWIDRLRVPCGGHKLGPHLRIHLRQRLRRQHLEHPALER